ncbi:hypothetical protein SAMN00777080_1521 [Aquiflexum balticum DSM 16537]|uniref:DUF6883 domain-containing protein n=1 Tax=Aquiflexum balticum DSM 16537 TaxID=758820 RepID=A0A1W2H1Y5_9BACT|nr:DUF6883 domain-containing protein [Aquiflexum balticum]SMD42950.1 hypothetical protein SAMN00777080_1521 [Aquiflexum balticum DSM 16537]
MHLPNFSNAYIDLKKLSEYCLNDDHPIGKYKARLFKSALNISKEHATILKNEILRKLPTSEAALGGKDHFGIRYSVNIKIVIFEKEAKVCTAWIIKEGESFPRLTSCYIKK